MKKYFEIMNKYFSKAETFGFKVANKLHIYSVNVLLLGCGYTIYTVLRDYNATFREERVV